MKYRDLIQLAPGEDVTQAGATGPEGGAGQEVSASGGSSEMQLIVSERLTRKTPAQKTQVEAYLARFARCYGSLNERMGEFVALFPIHPDTIAVLEKVACLDNAEVLRLLSGAVRMLSDEAVPEDHPGLVSYDRFWEVLRANPAVRSVPEFESVIECSRVLEAKFEKSFPRPEHKEMARRLLHALSVHRLTTGSVYSKAGVTAKELRDALCLHQPDVETIKGEPGEILLSQVVTVLDELRPTAGEHAICLNPDTGQYCLRMEWFKRFVRPELILHWVNAVPFVMLMITGGMMLASRFGHMERAWFALARTVHLVCAATWVIGLPAIVLLRFHVHWSHIRAMLSWSAEDLLWLVQTVRSFYNRKATALAAGRFNTGQKFNACLVMLYFAGFATTGVFMFWKATILLPWYVHAALFFAALASVSGHLYLSLLHPSTRGSLRGILGGWVPTEYVARHHPLSLPKPLRSNVETAGARSIMEEILVSKIELVFLAAALLMACAGVAAFSRGQMATAKRSFASSFSDLISPNQLSLKHRIGPAAESCVKCHSYAGEIPDAKCEQCHAVIKERRAALIGYHGTFKGECIQCHKEHPDGTRPVVPFDKDKFNHDLADYKLIGRHATLQCDECHKKPRPPEAGTYYIGLKSGLCTECHSDPHAAQFAVQCTPCHSMAGWKRETLVFDHNKDTTFVLAWKHASIACARCHKPRVPRGPLASATFKGLSGNCGSCHRRKHPAQYGATCMSCHTSSVRLRTRVGAEHLQRFPFSGESPVGKHLAIECRNCHNETNLPVVGRSNPMKYECRTCHQAEDPHKGTLGLDCERCHTMLGWKGDQLRFDHDVMTRYRLDRDHVNVACVKCHANNRWKGVDSSCKSCHPKKFQTQNRQ